MAKSPAHKIGQIIGKTLECIFEQILRETIPLDHYLDHANAKRKCRSSKLKLTDKDNNTHELDFLIEKDGSDSHLGTPVAFIECAWRRYKKHSKNKAQEIQSAIIPLKNTFNGLPFMGTILSGEYTKPAIEQLKSVGFHVIYIPFQDMIVAFEAVGIDIYFDSETSTVKLHEISTNLENIPKEKISIISQLIKEKNHQQISTFKQSLEEHLTRKIMTVEIMPIIETTINLSDANSIDEWCKNREDYSLQISTDKFNIRLMFNNETDALFSTKTKQEIKKIIDAF